MLLIFFRVLSELQTNSVHSLNAASLEENINLTRGKGFISFLFCYLLAILLQDIAMFFTTHVNLRLHTSVALSLFSFLSKYCAMSVTGTFPSLSIKKVSDALSQAFLGDSYCQYLHGGVRRERGRRSMVKQLKRMDKRKQGKPVLLCRDFWN